MWTCASMKPGTSTNPVASTECASLGTSTSVGGPTSSITPSVATSVASETKARSSPTSTSAPVIAIVWDIAYSLYRVRVFLNGAERDRVGRKDREHSSEGGSPTRGSNL